MGRKNPLLELPLVQHGHRSRTPSPIPSSTESSRKSSRSSSWGSSGSSSGSGLEAPNPLTQLKNEIGDHNDFKDQEEAVKLTQVVKETSGDGEQVHVPREYRIYDKYILRFTKKAEEATALGEFHNADLTKAKITEYVDQVSLPFIEEEADKCRKEID